MPSAPSAWKPAYLITPKTVRLLMAIETARAEIEHTPLPPAVEAELRRQARVRSAHFSTMMSGNRLTLEETEQAIRGSRTGSRRLERGVPSEPEPLRKLDRRARIVVGLFDKADRVAAPDVARALGLSDRMVRVLLRQWVKDGWLVVADQSRKKRAYELTAVYRQYVGSLSAMKAKRSLQASV